MMEVLAAHLADLISEPPAAAKPLAGETILISSRGMERWLSLRLADHHGICANLTFSFPRPFMLSILEKVTGHTGVSQSYQPEFLTWAVMKELYRPCDRQDFQPIRNYFAADEKTKPLKRYQLARRIAQVFDQYLAYRPDMINSWDNNQAFYGEDSWQPDLWRASSAAGSGLHPVALLRLMQQMKPIDVKSLALVPHRISLFGISALPPVFLRFLHVISSFTEIHLFLFNPCLHFWSDILSEKERETRFATHEKNLFSETGEAALFQERANPLLASMGRMGRDFLSAFADFPSQHQDFFVNPGETTLLRAVQSDILNLSDRGRDGTPRLSVTGDDDSIAVHSCHSPLREVEVLYDQILALIAADPTLNPRDFLVMAPDIETYAPIIESVFDRVKEADQVFPQPFIPFSISDRKHGRINSLTDAFFKILALAQSRFETSRVLALLENPAVQSCTNLSEKDVTVIRRWVAESGIRWGLDADTLTELNLPSLAEHTWKSGLDRMLLGYVMPMENKVPYRDIVPYDNIEGGEAVLFGIFLDFVNTLFQVCKRLRNGHSLGEWQEILNDIFDSFLIPEEETWLPARCALLDAIHHLKQGGNLCGFTDPVPLSVVHDYLKERLESTGFSSGFLSGGVTFCAMVPMRTIPFRIICLLGMNDESFPRKSAQLGFNLMEKHPRPGDRIAQDDDRYLFLQTILSARERILIFYTGQSNRDHCDLPPSVVVSELLDYLIQAFDPEEDFSESASFEQSAFSSWHDRLITRHPLQPFSPLYFSGKQNLFSFNAELGRAAASLSGQGTMPPPLMSAAWPDDRSVPAPVGIDELILFFRHPARFFATGRLGITLTDHEAFQSKDSENFTLSFLEKYEAEQFILNAELAELSSEEGNAALKASGILPPGTAGEGLYICLSQDIRRFLALLKGFLPERRKQVLTVDFLIGAYRLYGQLSLWSPSGFLEYRYAELKGKDLLAAWIRHLILCFVFPDRKWKNCLIGKNTCLCFHDNIAAENLLSELMHQYREGLKKPLKFFPQTSFQYAQARHSGKTKTASLALAAKIWCSTDYSPGEQDDPYFRLIFGKTEPLDEDFCRLAETIFNPILLHQAPFTESAIEPGTPPDMRIA